MDVDEFMVVEALTGKECPDPHPQIKSECTGIDKQHLVRVVGCEMELEIHIKGLILKSAQTDDVSYNVYITVPDVVTLLTLLGYQRNSLKIGSEVAEVTDDTLELEDCELSPDSFDNVASSKPLTPKTCDTDINVLLKRKQDGEIITKHDGKDNQHLHPEGKEFTPDKVFVSESPSKAVQVTSKTPQVDCTDVQRCQAMDKRTAVKRAKHVCDVCGYEAPSNYHLLRHYRRHSREKPFACSFCGRRFARSWDVQVHVQRRHTGEKSCFCPVCKRKFFRNSEVISHMKTHYKDRIVPDDVIQIVMKKTERKQVPKPVCNVCGYVAPSKAHLTRHMVKHSGEKAFVCTICEKRFGQKCDMELHRKRHNVTGNLVSERPVQQKHTLNLKEHEIPVPHKQAVLPACSKITSLHDSIKRGSMLTNDHDVASSESHVVSVQKHLCNNKIIENHNVMTAYVKVEDCMNGVDKVLNGTTYNDQKETQNVFSERNCDIQSEAEFSSDESNCKTEIPLGENSTQGIRNLNTSLEKVEDVDGCLSSIGITKVEVTDCTYENSLFGENVEDALQCDVELQTKHPEQNIAISKPELPYQNSADMYTVIKNPEKEQANPILKLDKSTRKEVTVDVLANIEEELMLCDKTVECTTDEHDVSKALGGTKQKKQHTCEKCGYSAPCKSHLVRHQSKHMDKSVPCNVCQKLFARQDNMLEHVKRKHKFDYRSERKRICPICPVVLDSTVNERSHMLSHSTDTTDRSADMMKCFYCEYTACFSSVCRHVSSKHRKTKNHNCPQCDSTFFDARGLKLHMARKHSTVRPYLCSICARAFVLQHELKQHMMKHQGIKPFACSVCPASFVASGDLKVHMRKHSGLKPFLCSQCGFCCSQLGNFKVHLLSHTALRPYKCTVCPYRGSTKAKLDIHTRTHTKERPFQCSVCSLRFSDRCNLRAHSRIHSNERPYKCSICDYSCRHPTALRTHERRH